MSENRTLDYYNKNASSFAETTIDVDFQKTQKRFQKLLPMQGYILDFGCGSGRDTKYFLSQHFQVDAIDGSEKLCRIASDYAGIKVKKMLFKELEEIEKYDGIWACSSILHLSKNELKAVFLPDDFMERITEIFMYQMDKKQSKRLLWKIVHKLLNKMV